MTAFIAGQHERGGAEEKEIFFEPGPMLARFISG
jgi:hypothetical protein